MLALVETIAKSLVDAPEEVSVRELNRDEDLLIIELRVASQDMGKVIGRQGRIAKALRTVVKAAAARQNEKVVVEIVS
ncbi:MAG TPA: KH domain-containing protein [Clostridiales bacterium]|jgi:predicted RNA-binding protein YlqC (UPF0109 family)|nr:KH domain-containing protein [Clostridiales bacterium]